MECLKFFNCIVLLAIVSSIASETVVPDMPPLIQLFGDIKQCEMTLTEERNVTKFIFTRNGFTKTVSTEVIYKPHCCDGWTDFVGPSTLQPGQYTKCAIRGDNVTYISDNRYNGLEGEIQDILSQYQLVKSFQDKIVQVKGLKSKVVSLMARFNAQQKRLAFLEEAVGLAY